MAKLIFKVSSDVEKVIKLREEVVKLKQEITNMSKGDASKTQKRINQATKEITSLVTEAAKAGQVFENDLKKKIFDSSKVVDTFSSRVINQKAVVRDVQADVKNLAEAYRNMSDININKGHTLKELQSARKVLDEEKASLFGLQQEQAKARLSVKGLKDEYSLLKDESKQVVNVNQGLAFSWKKMLGIIGGAAVFKKLGSDIVSVRGDMEALGNSFEVLLGSRKKSEKFVSEIIDYAVATPFSTSNISGAAQTLLGFNVEAEKVMPTLKQIGDISMGNTQRFDSLSLAFAQSSAAGRLLGQDLNQMINAGFNPLQIISEQTGKSLADLKKEMEKGGISSEMVAKAFEDATAEGGKFHGMLLKNADSINTMKNQLTGAFEEMYNDLGKKGEGVIKFSYQAGLSLVNNYETVGKVIASSVAVLGTYKTALVLTELIERRAGYAKLFSLKAQKMLNVAMNANPYALLATTIVGLVGAVWALSDSTSSAEKAQKRFNKKQEEASKLAEEHKGKIDSLIDSSRDIALTDIERGASLAELRKEYPKIFAQYDIETIKLADILDLKRQINAENKIKSEQENTDELANIEKEIAKYQDLFDSDGNESNLADYAKKIRDLKADRDVLLQELGKDISEQFIASFKDIKIDDFDKHIKMLEEQIKGKGNGAKIKMRLPIDVEGTLSNEAIYDTADIKNFIETLKTRKQSRLDDELNKTSNRQDLEEAIKKIKEAEKAYKLIVDNNDKYSSKQREQAKQDLEKAKKDYEALGGITDAPKSSKTEKDKSKDIQSQKRDEEDLAFQLAQAKINADKEGSEKVIAQIKLNQKKELLTLERNREDYLKKKQSIEKSIFESDGKNKDKKFDTSSVKLSVGENEMFDNLTGATNEKYSNQLSAVYADLLTKYQGYTEKRLEAQKKFQTDRENLVKAGASKGSLDENKYQEEETLKAIDNEFAMREDSFQNWIDSIANIGIEELRKRLVEAKKELERMEFLTPNNPELATQRAKVNKLDTLTDKPELKASPGKRSIKEWGDLYKVLGKVDKQFEEIGDSIGGTTGKILKGAGGITTATLQMVDSIIMTGEGSAKAMVGASTAAATAIKTVEKASVILAIIGAALQIATKITDMFAADYSKYEKAKENYQAYADVLDTVIGKQKELIETLTGTAVVEASNEALELIKRQEEAARKIGHDRLDAGPSTGSHSIGVRQRKRMDDDDWSKVREAIGYNAAVEKGRMHGLFDLSVKQLEELQKKAPAFWGKLDEDVRTYLETIIKTGETQADIIRAKKEQLTDISFDSLFDEFKSNLMDMEMDAKGFADNFEEYLKGAIINAMVNKEFKKRIEALYDDFAEYAESDGKLTDTEVDSLRQKQKEIAEDMLKEREKINEIFNFSTDGIDQESSKGGFSAMSQDTGDELNGRFTYNNVLLEEIKGTLLTRAESSNYLKANFSEVILTTKDMRDIADEIRTVAVNSYLELQGINEHTGNTVKELKGMGKILDKIDRNTSKL